MDKKTKRKRKDEYSGPGGADQEVEKASKEEYKVAKWIKSNVTTKKTKFLNHNVEYFSAVKALDALMASKFAQGDSCLFPHRQAAIDFLDDMLNHKFFHRAKKVPVSEQELRGGRSSKKVEKEGKEEKKDEKGTDAESNAEGKVEKNVEKEKKKRKIRLEMHPEQFFIDGHEAYVWIYDPIPMHYWIFGALMVVGAIVICLFPLWPPLLRKGVYYLSVAAAGFLVFILGLAVVRFIIFCLVWICTGGKHHFWLLPNLTEDVGFFASFWPLYKHEYKDNSTAEKKKTKKRKKDKDSDAEDDAAAPLLEKPEIEDLKEPDAENSSDNVEQEGETAENDEPKNSQSESESDEGSQRSSTGKDFEMVDPDDVDEETVHK